MAQAVGVLPPTWQNSTVFLGPCFSSAWAQILYMFGELLVVENSSTVCLCHIYLNLLYINILYVELSHCI